MRRVLACGGAVALLAAGVAVYLATRTAAPCVEDCLSIDYPLAGTLFPPDIAPPVFRWSNTGPEAVAWRVEVEFDDGRVEIAEATAAPRWVPTEAQWATIKSRSARAPATVRIRGFSSDGSPLCCGAVSIGTSADPVGAPLFYREVPLPFIDAVTDPSRIRWRFGAVSSTAQPPVVLENLIVCGNCHSFSADGSQLGMDIDYANDKGSYAIVGVQAEMALSPDKIITWNNYRGRGKEPTFGLLSQVSPDGRYVVSTVEDRSVFVPRPDLAFSQLFFPIKGILAVYDRQTESFSALPGADDPQYVQSNPAWSPDGKYIVFARARAYRLRKTPSGDSVLLTEQDCEEFLKEGKKFLFDLYRVPFNGGRGGTAEAVRGASGNGMSNYFAKYSPDGKWIVFCRAKSFMLLQPDSELYIVPGGGGEARRLACNTPRMNSWHTWSPNGRWLAFTSKANGPYSQLFLTHIDEAGESSPPVELPHFTAPDRAANIPEFVNLPAGAIRSIREQFTDDHSHWRAGNQYRKAKDWKNAERMYRKALQINPRSVESQCSLADVLKATGRLDEAIAHYRQVLELKPDSAEARYNLGSAAAALGRTEEAVAHYRQALALKPDFADGHNNLGALLAALGRTDEAIAHYRQAIGLKPGFVDAHNNLGVLLAASGKAEEAIGHYRRVLELKPDFAEAHYNLGAAVAATGRIEEAIGHYRRALALKPDFAEARNDLRTLLTASGRQEEALQEYERALLLRSKVARSTPTPRKDAAKTFGPEDKEAKQNADAAFGALTNKMAARGRRYAERADALKRTRETAYLMAAADVLEATEASEAASRSIELYLHNPSRPENDATTLAQAKKFLDWAEEKRADAEAWCREIERLDPEYKNLNYIRGEVEKRKAAIAVLKQRLAQAGKRTAEPAGRE